MFVTVLKELMLIRQVNKKSDICRYWYYLDKGFKFHMDVRNGCYDVLMMSINPNRLLF